MINRRLSPISLPLSALFSLFAGLIVGNFAYQLFAAQELATATERSFFQFTALLTVWIVGFIHQQDDKDLARRALDSE